MLSLLLALLFAAAPAEPDPLLDVVQRACTRNPDLVAALFDIERAEGLPTGLLAAAALRESSCRPEIHCGDGGRSCGLLQLNGCHWRGVAKVFRELHGSKPKGDPRRDWRASAHYWARRVKLGRKKAMRDCKGRGGYRTRDDFLWSSGNLTATHTPKCGRRICLDPRGIDPDDERCAKRRCVKTVAKCARRGRYETKHWRTLRGWRKKAKSIGVAKTVESWQPDRLALLAALRAVGRGFERGDASDARKRASTAKGD